MEVEFERLQRMRGTYAPEVPWARYSGAGLPWMKWRWSGLYYLRMLLSDLHDPPR